MSRFSPFLEGVLSAMVLLPYTASAELRYIRHSNIEKRPNNHTSSNAQDWQAVGMDISNASKKVGSSRL